jgi:hypothetical protein
LIALIKGRKMKGVRNENNEECYILANPFTFHVSRFCPLPFADMRLEPQSLK